MNNKTVLAMSSFYGIFGCFGLLFGVSPSYAETPVASPSQYGTLYVVDQKEQNPPSWKTAVTYGADFGDPYAHIHAFTGGIDKSLSHYILVGLQVNVFATTQSKLMSVLESELKASGLGQSVKTPAYSVYPVVTLVPLSGYLNFFGGTPLEMELDVRLGAGYVSYAQDPAQFGLLWSLRPMVHLSKNWSLFTGFGQEIEAPFRDQDRLARVRGEFGVSFQF